MSWLIAFYKSFHRGGFWFIPPHFKTTQMLERIQQINKQGQTIGYLNAINDLLKMSEGYKGIAGEVMALAAQNLRSKLELENHKRKLDVTND